MTGFLENELLRFEGLNDQDIADLNMALPAISQAITILQPHVPALLRITQTIIAKQKEMKS